MQAEGQRVERGGEEHGEGPDQSSCKFVFCVEAAVHLSLSVGQIDPVDAAEELCVEVLLDLSARGEVHVILE